MSSVYHILDKVPAVYYEDMQEEYENLAQALVKSGKLRIDTDYACNFARLIDPAINLSLMLSKEELNDAHLIPETKKYLKNLYNKRLAGEELDRKIAMIFSDLRKQISKHVPVNPEVRIKLARLLVQSAHPIVIKWLLRDQTQVFITYSHNIGDMMDIQNWQSSGSNSGMQSTDGKNVAVFVSCGGNPFGENHKDHPAQGDGWAAIARLQIIAGQELGHFADIKRDNQGRQITRHSANFSGTKATEHVREGRLKDISNCKKLLSDLLASGMAKLLYHEEHLKFYHKNKLTDFRVIWSAINARYYKWKLLRYARQRHLLFVQRFVSDRYMALMLKTMIEDMQFNLSPVADVYRRNNKDEEEAIACIEALARVPQQVMKWGYLTTMATMQNLYLVYYDEVIPSLIQSYNAMTNTTYHRNIHPTAKPSFSFLRNLNPFRKKEPKPVAVRDV